MRTIKFRGKRILDGKWIYGVPYLDGGWHIMIDSNTATPEEGTGSWSVDPATVGQFTGLTDKNGAEIYEGDIVLRFSNINKVSDPHLTDNEPEYMPASIEWISGLFRLSTGEFPNGGCGALNYSTANNASVIYVIGNIHDNPELLKNE